MQRVHRRFTLAVLISDKEYPLVPFEGADIFRRKLASRRYDSGGVESVGHSKRDIFASFENEYFGSGWVQVFYGKKPVDGTPRRLREFLFLAFLGRDVACFDAYEIAASVMRDNQCGLFAGVERPNGKSEFQTGRDIGVDPT